MKSVRVFSDAVDDVVVQVEGHRDPGLVVHGDRLQSWLRLASASDPDAIDRLASELQASVAEYDRICELFADDDADDEVPEPLATDDTTRLSVMARWDFVVRDEAAFLEYARRRFIDAHPVVPDDIDDHVGELTVALGELFHLDAGDFHKRYETHGVEQAGSGYTVDMIDQTLWEMTGTQREVAGY